MQVKFNSFNPQINTYNSINRKNNAVTSFGENPEQVVIRVIANESKFNKYMRKLTKGVTKLFDKVENVFAEKVIPKVFDNKFFDKTSVKFQDSDNLFKHFLAIGSAITSGMYIYKTLTNKKMDEDRKKTLSVNQFLTFVLSTTGAYTLDGSLSSWWQKMTAKYASASLEDPAIYTDYLKEVERVAKENKSIKQFNKTVSKLEKKDLLNLKVADFIKERLPKYLVNKSEQNEFMNLIKGMGFLKSMLVFALVYRYIVPVAVTKPANLLCEKYLAYKKSKSQQNASETAKA